ncbi:MAG: response regulator [Candidatus Rokubacteria bacterium]|nr:response regulator [Candidatus Rokubacteria bacterium]
MVEPVGAGKAVKILHVEDNSDNRRLVRRLLAAEGYQLLEAEDGLEGIDKAIREGPDLILLDIGLPRFDGYETAAAMRAFPSLATTLIVALTAYTNPGDRERILTAGCNGYIAKPIDVDRFPSQVAEFLRGKREQVEPAQQSGYLRELNQQLVQRLFTKIQEVEKANRDLSARGAQLESLHRIGEQITSQLSLVTLVSELLPSLAGSLGFAELEISLVDPETGRLVSWPPPEPRKAAPAAGGEGRLLEAPLAIQGRITGRLRARVTAGDLSAADAEQILRIVASQVAVSAENARLYEGLRRQMEDLRATQAQLVQSAKLAAIGELAANVAHEINNPMTSILGYATLMLDEGVEAASRTDYLKTIQSEALRIRETVRALLDFSRQRDFAMERVDIAQAVKDTLALIRRHAALSNIAIQEKYDPELPAVEVDVPQCKQVFLNLITNALDAMPHGGTLTVAAARDGEFARIDFADTGAGIPAANLEKIFDPFFTTKPAVKGTGLGLSVSLGIIQSHGGTIDVKSEVGKGSVFSVKLPIPTTPPKFS